MLMLVCSYFLRTYFRQLIGIIAKGNQLPKSIIPTFCLVFGLFYLLFSMTRNFLDDRFKKRMEKVF